MKVICGFIFYSIKKWRKFKRLKDYIFQVIDQIQGQRRPLKIGHRQMFVEKYISFFHKKTVYQNIHNIRVMFSLPGENWDEHQHLMHPMFMQVNNTTRGVYRILSIRGLAQPLNFPGGGSAFYYFVFPLYHSWYLRNWSRLLFIYFLDPSFIMENFNFPILEVISHIFIFSSHLFSTKIHYCIFSKFNLGLKVSMGDMVYEQA